MRAIVVVVFVLVCYSSGAQDFPVREPDVQSIVDELFPQQQLDLNYATFYDNILQRLSTPIELNSATEYDLRSLFILTETQVHDMIEWRTVNGAFLSVYELQAIPSFDDHTLRKLMPFVRVRDLTTTIDRHLWQRIKGEGNNYLLVRSSRSIQTEQGFKVRSDSTGFKGSQWPLAIRLRGSRPGDYSFGVTTENNPGEMLRWNPRQHYYGMDFISAHAQLQKKGWLKNIIAGDYTAQFGQGLVLGGGFGIGKGSETITTLRRTNAGFLPYTSAGEFNFFRGLAVSVSLPARLTLHLFVSVLKRDAVASADSVTGDYSFVSSFAITGLHRTARELSVRHRINERNKGVVIEYRRGSLEAGALIHNTTFDVAILKNPTVYNQFSFKGDRNTNISAYVNFNHQNFTLFGEVAATVNHGFGAIAGALSSLTPKLDIAVLLRNYQRNYQTFYSNAIAESTTPQNESGAYWGMKYVLSKKYYCSGYADFFYFPWLRYRAYAPGYGNDWLLRFNYQPAKSTLFFLQLREEIKPRNISDDQTLYHPAITTKSSAVLSIEYPATMNFDFKTRAQFSEFNINDIRSHGFVLLHDISFKAGRFSIGARYSIFHTDNYDDRIYVYERDVALAFSFPAYFGAGVHEYLLVQYHIPYNIDVWVRWAHTRFTDRDVVGTGYDQIAGNVRDDVKFQVRWRW